ncbi:putative disease resistance protein At3g14460 [Miscanthus floridulus]|uniref:putative disease resistance protein At3g14460 n=1 Tax=Miscanthus floridulus TaxID=154761 RepID=UPI003457FCF9
MMGVVDASIGWLVQTILGSLFTEQIEAWARGVGLDEDVKNLKSEMRNVQMVLAAAEGRRIDNKPLARSLDDLKELLYDAEDVMDKLDYYRLQQQIEQGDGCTSPEKRPASSSAPSIFQRACSTTSRVISSALHGGKRKREEEPSHCTMLQQQIEQGDGCTNPEKRPSSSSTPSIFQRACSTASRVISSALHGRKRKREEEPSHCTMLPYDIQLDISERIKGIVNCLHKLGNSVREVLHLEISSPIAMRNQNQYVAMNTRLTTSVPIEDKVYGRDAERDKIIELLINGKSEDLQVLPIVGIGGVGKTTLARFVYNDQRVKDHFDLRMWVCVSTNFDKVRLTREILEYVCTDRQQYERTTNFNILQQMLLKNIEKKRYLLVLDDMWEDKDRSGWVSLLAPLKDNHAPGCMILATTRRPSVAEMISIMDPVQVNGLDEKDIWLFFKACAFGNENHEGDPSLQSIGQHIVKILKGVPLAARSVGALLSRNVGYEHWRTVQNKWKSLQEDTDDILPILKLSYDFLPVHLQQCFSYCSLFPEDYRFTRGFLVHVWISQNFVQCQDSTKRLEETGMQYLDNLVDFGFFQKVDSDYVLHDLMHELAQMVSLNECATINGSNSTDFQPSVRHLSIDGHCSIPYDKFQNILENVGFSEKLRTLMVFGRSSIHLLRFLHTLCMKSKSLRVVRIYVTHDDVSPTISFLNPCHLRYLEFVWANVDLQKNIVLPQVLTKFYHLQFFNAGIGSNISVPTSMNSLINLRNIVPHEKVHLEIAGVGKLTCLQWLKFKVRIDDEFDINQLRSMNKLVTLEISQLENVKTKEQASGARLIDKEYLQKLSLSWNDISVVLDPCAARRTEDVLEGLQPHENLERLCITGYKGANSPTWLAGNVSIKMLKILRLEKCKEWRFLRLQLLPFLRKLTMIRMLNLVEISIPSLEELVLIEMPRLEKCLGTYGMELTSRLMIIIIKGCPQLNEFTPFQSYSSFHAEQKSWFHSLRKLAICYCPRVMNWEILPLGGMPLKALKLMDLHLVRELSVHSSLENLELIKMPRLERCSGLTVPPSPPSLEEQNVCLSSLHTLILQDCPSLMVSRPLPPSAHVRQISIQGKLSIKSSSRNRVSVNIVSSESSVLDDRILAFQNLRGMISLSIENCPKLISISSASFSQLTGLESLRIHNCSNLLKPPTTLEAAPETFPALPFLKYLNISASGISGLWLTKMLPHLPSLEHLSLHYCPEIKLLSISQPTETEGSCSLYSAVALSAEEQTLLKVPCNILCSLKKLTLSSCVDLEFYGGKGGFGGFTTLEKLVVHGCRKLGSLLVSRTKDDMDVALLPPSLKGLSISGCPNLQLLLARDTKDDTSNVDVGLAKSLEVLSLGCLPENLQSYSPKGLVDLRSLNLWDSPCLNFVQLHSCTALEDLHIWGCEQLGALESLQFLATLRSMKISRCPQLGALEGLQLLSSLGSLEIEMTPALSDAWERDPKLQEQEQGGNQIGLLPPSITRLVIRNLTNNVQSRLLSCLPAITQLAVRESPELTSLQLGYCKTLTELKIRDCESLASIEGFQSLTNLTSFTVAASSGLPPWMELLLQQQGACEVLSRLERLVILGDTPVVTMSFCKQLTSLRYLDFCGNRTSQMVNLTEEQERALQLLTSLQHLHFGGYPNLLLLPAADLRSLVSLKSLTIFSCPSISGLPEMPASCRLRVGDCSEELAQRCKEWEERRRED